MNDLAERYLTTRELATLLRIRERKVYELVANGDVPCSRVTGKLLFPRKEVEDWLAQNASGFSAKLDERRPNVLLGSHDPLLDWAVRESGCGLATYYDGSGDGLSRFTRGEGIMTGLHLFDPENQCWNVHSVIATCRGQDVVLAEFGWRDRGLLLAPDNPHQVESLQDITRLRLATRQHDAGAERLFDYQLLKEDIDRSSLNRVLVARTETEAATAVTTGEADVAFGLRAVAKQHQLDFIPIMQERFDLLVDRRAWFEPVCQTLFGFLRSDVFRARSRVVSGYDCSALATVHFNG